MFLNSLNCLSLVLIVLVFDMDYYVKLWNVCSKKRIFEDKPQKVWERRKMYFNTINDKSVLEFLISQLYYNTKSVTNF